jgi:hypothetical protein
MTRIAVPTTILGGVLLALLQTAPANAQASRTWVSGVGDDVNPCSRTAPCKTFAGAISKTATNGEINCLDSGGFGAVTITKSITIKCEGVIGGILGSVGNGVNVNDSASATPGTAIVTLSGLDIEGFATGTSGISFTSGAALHVHKTQIRGFRGGGSGINFAPTQADRELFVADSYITDNGNSTSNGGIHVRPTGSGGAKVSVNRTQIENNTHGIRVDGQAASGTVRVHVRDSVIAGNANNGVFAISNLGATSTFLERNGITGNQTGVESSAASSFMSIGGNTITQNLGIGMTCTAGCGGLQSFVNNNVFGNAGGDGATSGANLTPK